MIKSTYDCEETTEISVDSNGWNFLVIYGKHINGYYIAIPNHNVCCEAAEPDDTFYNEDMLLRAGIGETEAADIALAISTVMQVKEYSIESNQNIYHKR